MPINLDNIISCAANACASLDLPDFDPSQCECGTIGGRINDLYFIDCEEVITEANLLDTAWWTAAVAADHVKRMGVGIGSFNRDVVTTQDLGGCGDPTVVSLTWAITFQQFCVDKSTAWNTHDFADKILNGALGKYNVIMRLCDGEDFIIPVGKVAIADFNAELPSDINQKFSFTYKLTWKGLAVPTPLQVPGLDAVLPKATRG